MKKKKIIIISIIIIVLAAVAYWFFQSGKNKTQLVLEIQKPERGTIFTTVTSTGKVQPVDTVAVGSQVSGTIKSLYADYNSVVKKGQLLAELDKTLFQASLNQATSNYAQAQSQVVYQQGNYDRQSQLYKVGAISKAEYDNALYTYNAAKASASASAAQVQTAKQNLSLASIYSPIDGTVLSRSVSEGQTVAASFSTPTLFSIAKDLTKMQVQADVDEADIGTIQKGNRVEFSVDAFVNDVFPGTINEIRLNPTTTNNVVTYTTIISADNKDLKLKPGMTATTTIYTEEVNNALLIPVKAIKFTPDSSLAKEYELVYMKTNNKSIPGDRKTDTAASTTTVWIKQDNKLIQKDIKTGLNNNTQVEVIEGLTASDEVVTGASQLKASEAMQDASSPFMPKRRSSGQKKPN